MATTDDFRTDEARRLVEARTARGFPDAKAAADYFGWNYDTYIQHERGERGLTRAAGTYAKAYRVSQGWLRHGEGSGVGKEIPVVGYVGAGAVYVSLETGETDRVPAPEWANENTVAAVIRGQSLGALFDQWLIYYDQVEGSPISSMLNKLCVIGLADGSVVVKKLSKGQIPDHYTLFSNFDPPVYDVIVHWCAIVRNMSPR